MSENSVTPEPTGIRPTVTNNSLGALAWIAIGGIASGAIISLIAAATWSHKMDTVFHSTSTETLAVIAAWQTLASWLMMLGSIALVGYFVALAIVTQLRDRPEA